jgi:hypothetical protein
MQCFQKYLLADSNSATDENNGVGMEVDIA